MLSLLYFTALGLFCALVAAVLWQAIGPVMLLPLLPLAYALGYLLVTGRADPLSAWWERQRSLSG